MEDLIFRLARLLFRHADNAQQISETSPEAAPYMVGYVIALTVMVVAVNAFHKWINRK